MQKFYLEGRINSPFLFSFQNHTPSEIPLKPYKCSNMNINYYVPKVKVYS